MLYVILYMLCGLLSALVLNRKVAHTDAAERGCIFFGWIVLVPLILINLLSEYNSRGR